jgi:hypothetical protein
MTDERWIYLPMRGCIRTRVKFRYGGTHIVQTMNRKPNRPWFRWRTVPGAIEVLNEARRLEDQRTTQQH